MTKRSTRHGSFVIERTYPKADPKRVFDAWADPKTKARWFVGPDGWTGTPHALDFRIGGHETVAGGPPGGPTHTFESTFQDIVPNERIVWTYQMHIGDERMSVSIACVELTPAAGGTRMVYTEHGVFLDEFDVVEARREGTEDLIGKLGALLGDA